MRRMARFTVQTIGHEAMTMTPEHLAVALTVGLTLPAQAAEMAAAYLALPERPVSERAAPADAEATVAFWRDAGPSRWFAKDADFDRGAFHEPFFHTGLNLNHFSIRRRKDGLLPGRDDSLGVPEKAGDEQGEKGEKSGRDPEPLAPEDQRNHGQRNDEPQSIPGNGKFPLGLAQGCFPPFRRISSFLPC